MIENILADLIRIQSVNPPGGEIEVARYLKALFDRYEIRNEIIESAPGRGNFLAYIGEGERCLLYLSHTDVVPATEGWSFDPFAGETKDGFVHGRGAQDCKGLVVAEACAVIDLARNAKLGGRLIFAATADEEAGGTQGVKYLLENHRHKLMADFAINEGGEAPVIIGGKTCHFLGVGEKGPVWVRLKARGVSAHGSLPMLGDNAVVKMARVMDRLAGYQPQVVLIPEVARLIRAVSELDGFEGGIHSENVDQFTGRMKDRELAAYLNAITRMTVSPNEIRGGAKVNVVPDSCEAEVDIRVLPGQDMDYVAKELGPILSDVEMAIMQYKAPTFSSSDSDSYRLVSDVLGESIGQAPILPSVSSGATDSRFLREAGIPSYGISVLTQKADPAMRRAVHGKDEKIDIESLRLKSDFLVRLAKRYLGN
ncbi:MAG: M20/M25/M40 family metallo-hydrolase [Chloroflexota bacterium]